MRARKHIEEKRKM